RGKAPVHFIDEVVIRVRAGDGGKGAVAFRREKFVPLGGPSGGDGGDGGSVVLVVDEGLSTLLDFRYKSEFQAPTGQAGANKDRYGRGGDDVILRVPPGTQVSDQTTGDPGRGADHQARAQALGRRRPPWFPQCRQVVAHLANLSRTAQDRELSVHHAGSQPGNGWAVRRTELRGRRHPRAHRG